MRNSISFCARFRTLTSPILHASRSPAAPLHPLYKKQEVSAPPRGGQLTTYFLPAGENLSLTADG
jgi:hypothetical protein